MRFLSFPQAANSPWAAARFRFYYNENTARPARARGRVFAPCGRRFKNLHKNARYRPLCATHPPLLPVKIKLSKGKSSRALWAGRVAAATHRSSFAAGRAPALLPLHSLRAAEKPAAGGGAPAARRSPVFLRAARRAPFAKKFLQHFLFGPVFLIPPGQSRLFCSKGAGCYAEKTYRYARTPGGLWVCRKANFARFSLLPAKGLRFAPRAVRFFGAPRRPRLFCPLFFGASPPVFCCRRKFVIHRAMQHTGTIPLCPRLYGGCLFLLNFT